MTGLLLPPWRVVVSLPGLRVAGLLTLVGPVFVVWAGNASDTGMRLMVAGLAASVALALVWDDRCAPLAAATPVGLPAVRVGRGAVVLAATVTGWGACAVAAEVTVPQTPVTAIAVPVLALAALLLASIGWIARGRDGEPVATYPVPVLLLVLLLLSRLPSRWTLLVPPGSAAWPPARERWLVLLALSAVMLLWLTRDPASPPLRGRSDSRPAERAR